MYEKWIRGPTEAYPSRNRAISPAKAKVEPSGRSTASPAADQLSE